jgi:RNA ligase
MSYVNLDLFDEYVEKGLLIKQTHPTLSLTIWNYSRTCQYDRLWDEVTMACRGLVTDDAGMIIAKPFPKFFNYEEHTAEEIPNELFDVYEKMDGSLGICFYYNGEWHMATRGSFVSDQAIKGREMLQKYLDNPSCDFHTDYTYLFEIIYNENRIVCKYDFEDIVLLARIPTHKEYVSENSVHGTGFVNSFRVVKRYDGINDFTKLKGMISNDAEGYIIRFRNGMRMKIKGDEYVRLHRILTNFSTTDIWELLRTDGNLNEFLDRVPDEFDAWVKETVRDLVVRYENIEKEYKWIFNTLIKVKGADERKLFAEMAIRYSHPNILFSMLDGKSYKDNIYKIIKPKWSKPFKKDLDN